LAVPAVPPQSMFCCFLFFFFCNMPSLIRVFVLIIPSVILSIDDILAESLSWSHYNFILVAAVMSLSSLSMRVEIATETSFVLNRHDIKYVQHNCYIIIVFEVKSVYTRILCWGKLLNSLYKWSPCKHREYCWASVAVSQKQKTNANNRFLRFWWVQNAVYISVLLIWLLTRTNYIFRFIQIWCSLENFSEIYFEHSVKKNFIPFLHMWQNKLLYVFLRI
jgi:hypothetical protein